MIPIQTVRKTVFVLGLLAFLLAACGPRTEAPFRDYYVSIAGSDSSGNGSSERPWRTIQHAHDNADYSGPPVQIHIGAGTYTENLNITQDVILRGAGAGDPLEESGLTIIDRATVPDGREGAHNITDARVEIYNMVFQFGRVKATGGQLTVENVWFNWIQGLFGLMLEDVGAFSVIDSTFLTGTRVFADYGINVVNSTGEIKGTYFGDWLDHAINIARYPSAGPMVVVVDSVIVRGSSICYADGIRIAGGPVVEIRNSDIQRLHTDAEAPCQILGDTIRGDGIAAGIGIQQVPLGPLATHTIQGNVIAGFDMGIAIDARRTRVRAEGNSISGLTYGVLTWRWPSASSSAGAVVDFGGGPMGSTGNNIFINSGNYAFYVAEDYDVNACGNDWSVANDRIDPERINDSLDDPSRGRVFWSCAVESIEIGPTETLVQVGGDTPTPTAGLGELIVIPDQNYNCRYGNSSAFDIADTLLQGEEYAPVGIGNDNLWFQFEGPSFGELCWTPVSAFVLFLDGIEIQFDQLPATLLQVVVYPPLPPTVTPTPDPDEGDNFTPTPLPSATATCYYNQNNILICP